MEQWDVHAHACMDMEASMERSQVPRTDLINWIEDRMKGVKQKYIKQLKTRFDTVCACTGPLCGRTVGHTEIFCCFSSLLCSNLVVYIEVLG